MLIFPVRTPVIAATTVVALLAVGWQVSSPSAKDTGSQGCGHPSLTESRRLRLPHLGGPSGGVGSAPQTGHQAPPATVPSPPPPPTLVNGRITLTAANPVQTVFVPPETMIDVRLEPAHGKAWTVPESSDPKALPRMSASSPADTVKTATFRAVAGSGRIMASVCLRPVLISLNVTVHVTTEG